MEGILTFHGRPRSMKLQRRCEKVSPGTHLQRKVKSEMLHMIKMSLDPQRKNTLERHFTEFIPRG